MPSFGELAKQWAGNFRIHCDEQGHTIMECGATSGTPKEIWIWAESPGSLPLRESQMQRLPVDEERS